MRTFLAESAESADADRPSPLRRRLFSRPRLLLYGMALLAVGVVWLARIALAPILHDYSPYLLFMPAVLVAAGLGGWGPGLAATGLATVLGLLATADAPNISGAEAGTAIAFLLIGVGVAWSGEQLQRNRLQAAASARQAVAREAHLTSILDTVPDAMIVIDERGLVQSFSYAAERLFGYKSSEVVGTDVEMMMAVPHRE